MVLQEVAGGEVAVELLVGEEPVVDTVALTGPARTGGRRDGQPQLRHPGKQQLHHRPLAGAGGAVRTKTGRLPVEERNQFLTLAARESADRLRLADPALVEHPCRLDVAELRHRQQHVEDLRGRDELWWIAQDLFDRHLTGLQILLELGAAHPDVVGPLECFHPLIERSDWSLERCTRGHHEGASYHPHRGVQAVLNPLCDAAAGALVRDPEGLLDAVQSGPWSSSASSSRTRAGASGSLKSTVPSATSVAPQATNSSTSRPLRTPPIATIGRPMTARQRKPPRVRPV